MARFATFSPEFIARAIANLVINFHTKQWVAFVSKATELLFGGSAGPGKSHLMRLAAIMWCLDIPGLNVYLFRRVEDDLRKNHMEGPSSFPMILAPLVLVGLVRIVETEIRFWNGSRIFLCHCKDEKHRFKYHGAEIHVLLIDELTTFTETIYRYLRFRVRMTNITLPDFYRKGCVGKDGKVNEWDLFPRVLCASNPGNVGHHWVKRTWGLDIGNAYRVPLQTEDIEGGMYRQYIPALLSDNPTMEQDDPNYVKRMRGLGDPMLVRAMELGDWNILAGAFFSEFRLERHVLKAVTPDWTKFTRVIRGEDWGSAKPFSVGWYAIADEDVTMEGTLGNQIVIPRGSLVRYREWYGKKANEDNVGVKMPVAVWARGILKRTPDHEGGKDGVLYDVADPAMWGEDGGPSLAEQAMNVKHNGRRLKLRKADNRRVGRSGAMGGWDQMRLRLRGEDADEQGEGGTPLLFLMDNQPDAIRLIQAAQHDELKPEDLDTDMEDHALDEIRYVCMSRPRAAAIPQKRKPRGPKVGTLAWLDHIEKRRPHSTYNIEA